VNCGKGEGCSSNAGAAERKKTRGFDLLVDVTCVDYLNYFAGRRIGLGRVYLLANTAENVFFFSATDGAGVFE